MSESLLGSPKYYSLCSTCLGSCDWDAYEITQVLLIGSYRYYAKCKDCLQVGPYRFSPKQAVDALRGEIRKAADMISCYDPYGVKPYVPAKQHTKPKPKPKPVTMSDLVPETSKRSFDFE